MLRRAGISRLSFIDRPTRTVVRYERAEAAASSSTSTSRNSGRIRRGRGLEMHGPRDGPATGEMKRNPVGYDYLHVAVDDNSRVAFVQALADEKAPTCAQFIRDATAYFAAQGVTIERVMTDNARNYTPLNGFQEGPGRSGNRSSTHPALSAPDQWKSGAVQPDPARRVRLQDSLHFQ